MKPLTATALAAAAIIGMASTSPIYRDMPGPKGKQIKDRSKAKAARKARRANRK